VPAASLSARPLAEKVALVAIEMGYGHLRAAHALADAIGCATLELDRPPLATAAETRRWQRARSGYELISRASQLPVVGRGCRSLIEWLTEVPSPYGGRRHARPALAVSSLERMADHGLGDTLVAYLKRNDATLLTTFYAPAIIAQLGGLERVVCVVTDADFNRVWVPYDPRATVIHYCAPSERVRRRLLALGVPVERVHLTGFPLPPELTGGDDLDALRHNLASRLVRLDPSGSFRASFEDELRHFLGALPGEEAGRPPLVTFAVGGAGAQLQLARAFLPSLAPAIQRGRLALALVAGTRRAVADELRGAVTAAGLESALGGGVEILLAADFDRYYRAFSKLLARTDVLWSKPSEMTFYGALGLPLVFSPPIGAHERYNQRWARERGAGLKQNAPHHAGEWLREWLEDGVLAAAAWAGYLRLPKFGTERIVDVVARVAGG
jgi:hypothetical protein